MTHRRRVQLAVVQVTSSPDLVVVRQRTRSIALRMGLEPNQVTKLGTALSEVCRTAMATGPATLRFQLLGSDRLAIDVCPPVPWGGVLPLVRDLGGLLTLDGDHVLCIQLPKPLDDEAFQSLDRTDRTSELQQIQVAHQELVHAHHAEERARRLAERSNLELAAANEALARRGRELARSYRDLEVVAAAAAHDLKEPLQVIRMFAAVMERSAAANQKPARIIQEAADRMAQMLDGLMTLSRVRGESQGVALLSDVVLALQADLTALLERTGGEIDFVGDARVSMSPAHLRATLQNLVGNGLKYARPEVPPRVRVTVGTGPRGVQITVEDNGRGIPQEHRQAVFELFQRLERDRTDDGTGVGLALVRRILDEYEGAIRVEDGASSGTRMVLDLPGVPEPACSPDS